MDEITGERQPDPEKRLYRQPAASLFFSSADGYATLRPSLSHAHSLSRSSRRGGRLRSWPLGGSRHRSLAFTFKPAAGSFAVDSAGVIHFIRPL